MELKIVLRKLLPLFLPLCIIIGAAVLSAEAGSLPGSAQNLILYFSYILLGVVILLSFIFNRSRVFFIASVIFISQVLLMTCKADKGIQSFNIIALKSIIYVILPVDITVFALQSDKGILTLKGKLRIAAVIFEYLFILWVIVSKRTNFIGFISSTPIYIGKLVPVPLFIFLTFCIAFIFFLARIVSSGLPKDRLLSGALISIFMGLFYGNTYISIPVFFSAAGIILLICSLYETYFLAYIDELTGLPSRRALKDRMLKLGGRYSIAMLDIDFFKKFNDNYGHDSGDEVLRFIGKTLKQMPGGGKSYRYGGEEFTIIFPGKSSSEAVPHLERLRENISKSRIPISKGSKKSSSSRRIKKVSITISCGVADRNEKHSSPMDVIKAADAALYKAKEKGRNCVAR